MAKKVKFLLPVVERNTSSGDLTSYGCGDVAELDDAVANAYISDGYAELYTLVTPTGTKTITENGEGINVAGYADADVAVPGPTGKITITANGTDIDVAEYATADVSVVVAAFLASPGTIDSAAFKYATAVNGSVADPGNATPPADKTFSGWKDTAGNAVTFPATVESNTVFVAAYED